MDFGSFTADISKGPFFLEFVEMVYPNWVSSWNFWCRLTDLLKIFWRIMCMESEFEVQESELLLVLDTQFFVKINEKFVRHLVFISLSDAITQQKYNAMGAIIT